MSDAYHSYLDAELLLDHEANPDDFRQPIITKPATHEKPPVSLRSRGDDWNPRRHRIVESVSNLSNPMKPQSIKRPPEFTSEMLQDLARYNRERFEAESRERVASARMLSIVMLALVAFAAVVIWMVLRNG